MKKNALYTFLAIVVLVVTLVSIQDKVKALISRSRTHTENRSYDNGIAFTYPGDWSITADTYEEHNGVLSNLLIVENSEPGSNDRIAFLWAENSNPDISVEEMLEIFIGAYNEIGTGSSIPYFSEPAASVWGCYEAMQVKYYANMSSLVLGNASPTVLYTIKTDSLYIFINVERTAGKSAGDMSDFKLIESTFIIK